MQNLYKKPNKIPFKVSPIPPVTVSPVELPPNTSLNIQSEESINLGSNKINVNCASNLPALRCLSCVHLWGAWGTNDPA